MSRDLPHPQTPFLFLPQPFSSQARPREPPSSATKSKDWSVGKTGALTNHWILFNRCVWRPRTQVKSFIILVPANVCVGTSFIMFEEGRATEILFTHQQTKTHTLAFTNLPHYMLVVPFEMLFRISPGVYVDD